MTEISILPNSWVQTNLDAISSYIQRGKSPKYIEYSDLPVVNQKCIRWDGIDVRYIKYIHPEQKAKWAEQRYLIEQDILWNSTGTGTIGRATIFKRTKNLSIAVVDSHVTIVRILKKYVLPQYTFYYLMSPYIQRKIEDMQSGSTNQVELGKKVIQETLIPIAPFPEQHRIVAKIEELFSELDQGIQSLRKAQQQLKIYRQSVLKWAFEGKLTAEWREQQQKEGKLENAERLLENIKLEREKRYQQQVEEWKEKVKVWEENGKEGKKPSKPRRLKETPPLKQQEREELFDIPFQWKWMKVSSLLYSIRGGTNSVPQNSSTNYPILRSSSIRPGIIDYSDVRFISKEKAENIVDYLEAGDLLFTRLNGTIDYVGNCAMVTQNHPENLIYPDRLYCAKSFDSVAKYIQYLFLAPHVRKIIENKAKSTAEHKRISITDILDVPLPLACNDEQNQIVKEVETRFSICDQLETIIKNNLEKSEALRQSILKKAFEGNLVPQDPKDEPAEKLLERIKQDKVGMKNQVKQLTLETC